MRPPTEHPRLRVAWWGPSGPATATGVWQTELLVPELSTRHDVVTVTTAADAPADTDVDLHVYQLESGVDDPSFVHDAALHRPGLVVLHDRSLLHLYRALYGDDTRLAVEVRHCYGDLVDLELRLETACAEDGDPLDLPLLRRVCESSRAVVVHDLASRDDLARQLPLLPVLAVPLAVPPAPARRGVGSAGELRVAVLGGPSRLELAELAAGTVRRTGVAVTFVDPSPRLDTWLDRCDLVVDLRWPSAGGPSRETLAAVRAGIPTAVSRSALAPDAGDDILAIPYARGEVVRELCSVFVAAARGELERGSRVPAGASARVVALRYDEVFRDVMHRPASATGVAPAPIRGTPVGVNVVGDFDATTGLMEAGRRLLRSIVAAGVDVQLQPRRSAAGRSGTRRTPDSIALPYGRQHDIDLLLLNINEMSSVTDEWLRPPGTDRHVIGAWFWELSELTEDLARHTQRVDEVWVASEFVRGAFRGAFRGPVVLVPPAVETLLPPHFDAAQLGIRDGSLVFFFNFDALSTAARKNPWGVIDAFARAFGADERASTVQLVIKVHNLERVPGLAAPLAAAIAGVDGLLIDAELSRSEMNGLLGRCDVYASLHRSEGFGLGMAEAMYLAKPVIATAYSGNIDFTLPTTSCLVGYRMRPVTSHDHRHYPEAVDLYPSGLVWAEPDIDAAGRWMRLLADTPALRERVGAAGAREIRARYSPRAQQAAVVERLEALRRLRVEPERPVDELEVPLGSGAH